MAYDNPEKIDWKKIRIAAFLLTIGYFLRGYLYTVTTKFVIHPFGLDEIKSTTNNDAVAVLLIFFYLFFVGNNYLKRRLVPTTTFFILLILFVLWYILAVRASGVFSLTPFKLIPVFKYLDAVYLISSLLFTRFRYTPLPEIPTKAAGFLEDDFKMGTTPDILGRKKYSVQIARGILDTQNLEKSFVLAINSPWGFGKSAFLAMIRRSLTLREQAKKKERSQEREYHRSWAAFIQRFKSNKAENGISPKKNMKVVGRLNPTNNEADSDQSLTREEKQFLDTYKSNISNTVIVNYNPWRNLDDKKIIKDFLDELASALKAYHTDLSGLIKKYSKYLGKLNESKISKIIEASVESLKSPETPTALYDEINVRISEIKKRIVVFIDDLDRLNGDELIDVVKLVRNTANFRNTIFIIAYDHNYVLNTIDKKNLISNKEEYLHKIVQLELTLPTYDNNILLEYFHSTLRNIQFTAVDLEKINGAIIQLSNIAMPPIHPTTPVTPPSGKIETMSAEDLVAFAFDSGEQTLLVHALLRNVRDVTRLTNSFRITYNAIGDVADTFDILLLEIIKIRYLSIYQLLSNGQLIKLGQDGRYIFSAEAFAYFTTRESCTLLNVKFTDKPMIEKCLLTLFSQEAPRFFRSVSYPAYFKMYFSYDAPGIIELTKIEEVLKDRSKNLDEFLSQAKPDQLEDIKRYIYSQNDFTELEQYQSTIATLFHLVKYDDRIAISQLRSLLHNTTLTQRLYGVDWQQAQEDFVMSILMNKQFPLVGRYEIAFEELYKIVNRNIDEPDTIMVVRNKIKLQEIMFSCLDERIEKTGFLDSFAYEIYVRNLENIELPSRTIRVTERANILVKNLIVRTPYQYLKTIFFRKHPEPAFKGQWFHFDPFIDLYFEKNFHAELDYLKNNSALSHFTDKDRITFLEIVGIFESQGPNRPEKFFVDDPKAKALSEFIEVFTPIN